MRDVTYARSSFCFFFLRNSSLHFFFQDYRHYYYYYCQNLFLVCLPGRLQQPEFLFGIQTSIIWGYMRSSTSRNLSLVRTYFQEEETFQEREDFLRLAERKGLHPISMAKRKREKNTSKTSFYFSPFLHLFTRFLSL